MLLLLPVVNHLIANEISSLLVIFEIFFLYETEIIMSTE